MSLRKRISQVATAPLDRVLGERQQSLLRKATPPTNYVCLGWFVGSQNVTAERDQVLSSAPI